MFAILDGLVHRLVEVLAVDVEGDERLSLFGDEVGVVTVVVLRHRRDGRHAAFAELHCHRLLQRDAVAVQLFQQVAQQHVAAQCRGRLDTLPQDVHLLVVFPFC